jgi:hypothetical protein
MRKFFYDVLYTSCTKSLETALALHAQLIEDQFLI